MLGGVDESISEKASYDLPLYTVGPATARSLTSLRDTHLRHAVIHGADTGNGENLAHYILDHYNDHIDQLWTQAQAQLQPQSQLQSQIQETAAPRTTPNKPPLLFLVGEQRRDIIPRTLMNEAPIEKKIGVEEVVVYETGVVEGFESDFEGILVQSWVVTGSENGEGGGEGVTWVIVFSPTGCDAMVRVLAKLKSASGFGFEEGGKSRRIYVATIGPTTRDHLVKSCGFEPDVCADKPSPDGLGKGIEEFMRG
ncbi:tetrapyrrole biosynthesis, uroporphyrinogen III synthase [Aspergillus californicus]